MLSFARNNSHWRHQQKYPRSDMNIAEEINNDRRPLSNKHIRCEDINRLNVIVSLDFMNFVCSEKISCNFLCRIKLWLNHFLAIYEFLGNFLHKKLRSEEDLILSHGWVGTSGPNSNDHNGFSDLIKSFINFYLLFHPLVLSIF